MSGKTTLAKYSKDPPLSRKKHKNWICRPQRPKNRTKEKSVGRDNENAEIIRNLALRSLTGGTPKPMRTCRSVRNTEHFAVSRNCTVETARPEREEDSSDKDESATNTENFACLQANGCSYPHPPDPPMTSAGRKV